MLKIMKLDWFTIKYYRIRILLVPIALLALGGFSSIYLVPMGVILLFSFSVNFFAVEEKGDLNRLYLTLPLNRSRIVIGRYLMSLLFFLSGTLLGFALMPLTNLFSLSKWYADWKWALALGSFGFLLYALMNLSMYPLLFRLGYHKGKIWGYYIPTILIALAYLAIIEWDIVEGGTLIRDLLVYASEHILFVSGGLLLLSAVLCLVSLQLSLKSYARREF